MRVTLALLLACAACGRTADPPIRPVPLPKPDGRAPSLVDHPLSPRIASYKIRARLDTAAHTVTGTETLTWKHTGTDPVQALPFHLYMNAFKNETTVFMKESGGRHRGERKNDKSWGWIDVSSIKLGEDELRPQGKFGEDETTLTVPLPRPVASGEEVTLEIAFTAQLPEVFARTGYKGEFHLVGQWFPKIGVLLADGWHCDTFHLNSEFFADFGNYEVELTVPETHVVAATGVLVSAAAGAGTHVLTYRAEDVHDFVFMADPWMQMDTTTAKSEYGSVEVRVYHRGEQAAFAPRHLEAAQRTIEGFGHMFVPYPWPIMSVIDPPRDAAGSAGGMEYPMLVTTAADLPLPRLWAPEMVTVHEVGHNWFQGMLASNEVDEAFLDEGFNEYADGLVLDDWKGEHTSMVDNAVLRMGYYDEHRLADVDEYVTPIATRSYEFAPGEYGGVTYGKTALVLKTLENMAGREPFLAAMKLYATRNAFKHPTRADFFAAMKDGLPEDYSWFIEPAFLGTGGVDFQVGPVSTRRVRPPRGVFGEGKERRVVDPDDKDKDKDKDKGAVWESRVAVFNVGKVPARVEVDFVFEDGTRETLVWSPHGPDGDHAFKRFILERKSPVVAVEVDPRQKVVLENKVFDDFWREDPSTGPSWRAGARAGFWEQTLEQVMGL